jgi:clan AA aspartic protease
MGIVMNLVKLTNDIDLSAWRAKTLKRHQVRSVTVAGLVDTGATGLIVPGDVIAPLGLSVLGHNRMRLADGTVRKVARVGPVRLEILGRDMVIDALVMPRGKRVLIGQIPLEMLDLVVEPRTRKLRPNPEHPDAPELDALAG